MEGTPPKYAAFPVVLDFIGLTRMKTGGESGKGNSKASHDSRF